MRLTMVGTGYVGLVTGVCFSNVGNDVVCLDVDPGKIERLKRGECPIYEPGLGELIEYNLKANRLHFTTDPTVAYEKAEVIFICVGTPTGDDGKTDMKYIWSAADDIAKALKRLGPSQKPKVVVVKSTVPVGTTIAVRDRIRAAAGPDIPFSVANNPEFLKEGAAVNDFNKPDRVVVGVEDERTGDVMRLLYEPFVLQGHPIFVLDILSSEMVKYASNNFLATKISFINEMALLCEKFGADIAKVRQGMCSDKRIGDQFLYPGLGYGGSCFPKDTLACIKMGEAVGLDMPVSKGTHEVNQRQRRIFFEKMKAHFAKSGGLRGKSLAFWGMAFKPRTDDIREAPAIDLMLWSRAEGASCRGFDPVAADNVEKENPGAFSIVGDMYAALEGADAVIISTDWADFKTPDFDRMRSLMRSPVIFDGRNLYRHAHMRATGFWYYSVGRPAVAPS